MSKNCEASGSIGSLREANRQLREMKVKFLSHLAHELITLVAVIEVSLDQLYKGGVPKPELERMHGRVRRSLDRFSTLFLKVPQ